MQTEIRRRRGRNYFSFRLETETGDPYEQFQQEMCRRNQIPGLACGIREWENESSSLCYEITGKQPLSRILEMDLMSAGMLDALIGSLGSVLESAEQYFLEPDHLRLDPGEIYLETDSAVVEFFFCTEETHSFTEQMRALSRRLLEIKLSETGGVMQRVLSFYRYCAAGQIDAEGLKRLAGQSPERSEQERSGSGTEAAEHWKTGRYRPGQSAAETIGNPEIIEAEQPSMEWEDSESKDDLYFRQEKRTGKTGRNTLWKRICRHFRGKTREPELWEEWRWEAEPEWNEDAWKESDRKEPEAEKSGKREEKEETDIIPERKTQLLFVEEPAEKMGTLWREDTGEQIPLIKSSFLIGQQEGMDYGRGIQGLSRMHLKLEMRCGEWFLTDLNSTNGTWLNQEAVLSGEEVRLKNGDRIRAAGTVFLFENEKKIGADV